MCTATAQQTGFLNSESSTVRFAMKLPRWHAHSESSANSNNTNASHGINIRKTQSASAASSRNQRTSPIRTAQQGPSNQDSHPTQGLPIPCQPGGRSSLSRSVDKSDLTRMYDYATWNMYERIVSARRMRLASQMEHASHQNESSSATRSASNGVRNLESRPATTKIPSQDDGTADETDKSSTASSLTDSPAFHMGMSPSEGGGNEDHFIFQLDM